MTQPLTRNQMAWRAAQDIADGAYVNLGLGMPVLVANFLPADRTVMLQSENGIVGIGRVADDATADPDLVDAGGQRVTLCPGAALTDSVGAFTMINGGHIDVTMLGAFQVAANGDLANWDAKQPGKGPLVGGAMDLATNAKEVRVIMGHTTKQGAPCLVEACDYPLTAPGVVKRVYTDLAVIEVTEGEFVAREMLEGLSGDDLQAKTGAPLRIAQDCAILWAPDL
ncbi:MAG: 3-oxoacid CoA-transferase subunit B [Alphaproteobacteria bacterium]|nr:3-oxoacid CoA-transferase subunit B [Alphaproteobacteria bacterium]